MHPIVCENVSKNYRKKGETVIALEKISLDVREGEVMMLVGKTGAGKTTLLKLIAGREHSERGEISLLGESIKDLKGEEKARFFAENVGFILEDIPLFSSLTVEENVRLPLIYNKTNKKLQDSIVEKILNTFGMISRKKSFPSELSQGERQIILLARALVHEPKILLFDDAFSALDHQMGMKFTTLLRSYALDKGMAILMATHDARLYPFAHRLVKMQEGNVKEILGEAAVYEPPPPYMRI